MKFSVSAADLAAARDRVAGASCWVLTDGKAGDEAQCLGVAERLGLSPEVRRVRPRPPWLWLMPFGPIDPAERPAAPDSPLRPPWPDIAIASGRRAVAYLRRLRRLRGRATLTVFLKDPGLGAGAADVVWVPAHDRLRGPNVIATVTSPHRLSPERLAAARAGPAPWPDPAGRALVGVLAGGDSRHHRFTEDDRRRLVSTLRDVASSGALLSVTPSRRTPPELKEALRALCQASGGWFWDGAGDNPYLALLAKADHLVVTADSVNMIGEAAATGKPVHLFTPSGGHRKIAAFLGGLAGHGAVRELGRNLASWSYEPIDATPEIAVAVAEAYAALRRGENWRRT